MRSRPRSNDEGPPPPNTVIGVGSSLHGTLMVSGTLRIEGEFEGDVLNCERIEIGEHGVLRADVEVREAWIAGRVIGNIRATETVLRGARGFGHNDFKIELARRAILRALTQAARGTPQSQSNKKIG